MIDFPLPTVKLNLDLEPFRVAAQDVIEESIRKAFRVFRLLERRDALSGV